MKIKVRTSPEEVDWAFAKILVVEEFRSNSRNKKVNRVDNEATPDMTMALLVLFFSICSPRREC